VERKNKDGTSENILCPEIVKQYNANMGFVDKADMLESKVVVAVLAFP
jgi:hypothetical protein